MAGRFRITSVGIAIAAVLLSWQPGTKAQQRRGAQAPASVLAAAAQGQQVRVIVGVRVDGYRAEGALALAGRTQQRAAIQSVSQRVLSRLQPAVAATGRTFDFIPFFSARVDANTLLQFESDPDVVSIEEDRMTFPTLAQSVPLIGAPAAWSAGFSGAGWAVAILDSGVDKTHSFLSGKVVSEGCYSNQGSSGPTSLCPAGVGSSVAAGSGVPCVGLTGCDHGTHVAGIAAGKGPSFSGVARDASILAFQVFTQNGSTIGSYPSDQIAAMNRVYALRNTYNIASVNMSLGGSGYTSQPACDSASASTKAAIDLLRSVNIATVIASGNNGYVNAISTPGCISSAISVGSTTDTTDAVSGFTNSATFLSLLAPGETINSSVPGNAFGQKNGTSMATPHVAGAWAVLKQRAPAASVSDILNALRETGLSVTDPGNGLVFPRIRVDQALGNVTIPLIGVNSPSSGGTVGASFAVVGWAIDRKAPAGTTGIDQVHVYAYPSGGGAPIALGVAMYGLARSDVGAAYGSQFTNSGFSLNASGLTPGNYQISIFGHSTVSQAFNATASLPMTVSGPTSHPAIALGAPMSSSTSGSTVTVNGWAVDTGAPSGTGVDMIHVYAFPSGGGSPTFMGSATYGGSRPDVASIFGAQFTNSGFLLQAAVAPGNYTIVAYMRSTVTGTFNASASAANVTVNSTNSNPMMLLDGPPDGSTRTRPFVISGWAVDTGAASGTGIDAIHIWAFPTNGSPQFFVGVGTYGTSRPDVGTYLGDSRYNNSGFTFTATSGNLPSPGSYDFQIFGHSTVTGSFTVARVVRVTVQ